MNPNTKHTYEMGIIGNCAYLGYINKMASVEWLCWPYFDSSFIFGSLLDDQKGGQYSIQPEGQLKDSHQYYLKNTNILVTEFQCSDGAYRVIDFAPRFELFERHHKPLMLFRKIERISGNPRIKVICSPVGEYGEAATKVDIGSNSISYRNLDTEIRLTTNLSKILIANEQSFALTEDKYLVLSYGKPMEAPLESTFEEFLRKTTIYWRKWIERSTIPSFCQESVIRSALLLKMHQFEDTGAIIASGTTSLPEHPDGGRNWDYRYCWVRDSYFTLSALDSLSHFEEMEKYSHYIQNLVSTEGDSFQPVYRIDGPGPIPEWEAPLKGYKGNQPVRIGNQAYEQIQNDVYGQIILSLLPLYTDARLVGLKSRPPIALIKRLLDLIDEHMEKPDAGIWEFRNRQAVHTESLLFHWAGAKGAIKIAQKEKNNEILEKAQVLEKKARINLEKCYSPKYQAYMTSQEGKYFNASEFLLLTMNYLDAKEERTWTHFNSLTQALKADDSLFYRYKEPDDFGETHSTFLICGFWYAEALASLGEVEKAKEVFNSLVGYSNHLGIFSEDVDPKTGSQWGNFGQTYSHVGLINTAFRIDRKQDKQLFE